MLFKRDNPEQYAKDFEGADALGDLLGAKFISVNDKECLYEYEAQEGHYNPNGILHGGALYSVMDSSQGAFVHFILDPQYKFAATGTATIRYNAPVTRGKIKIRTWLEKIERRKMFIQSSATDSKGTEVATLDEIWIAIPK